MVNRSRQPSAGALEVAQDVARRVHQRPAPLRVGFIERADDEDDAPLAQMLRGGQGGAVRTKLYLSLIFLAAAPPHDATYPARAWAQLLDLPDPETNGARRIASAITWLQEHGFVAVDRNPGRPSRVVLRDERGTRQAYRHPATELLEAKEQGLESDRLDYYVQLAPELWTKGWITLLSGPSLAMFLALVAEAARRGDTDRLWFSPQRARERFGLSDDTRSTGFIELERLGLVDKRRQAVNRSSFDFRMVRNTYTLRLDQLEAGPGKTAEPEVAPVTLLKVDDADTEQLRETVEQLGREKQSA